MTEEEFIKEFNRRIRELFRTKYKVSHNVLPRDTGNLQDNAFKLKKSGKKKWVFYIDETVAPYAPHINSKRWGTTWWDGRMAEMVRADVLIILNEMNALVDEDDIKEAKKAKRKGEGN